MLVPSGNKTIHKTINDKSVSCNPFRCSTPWTEYNCKSALAREQIL